MEKQIILSETDDFHALSTLFHNSGMGVAVSDRKPDRIIKMWRLDDTDGNLIAAATLEVRDHVYSLGDIAVHEDFRKRGYSTKMQEVVFAEARSRGIKELWACARVPSYYLRHGWEIIPWDSAPHIDVYCRSCGKRGTTCFPEIMHYTL